MLNFAKIKLKYDEDVAIPILSVKIVLDQEIDHDQWNAIQSIFDEYHDTKLRCRIVVDLSKIQSIFSMSYMSKWITFFHTNRKYLRECVSYVAFISENFIFKQLFNILKEINPPVIPFYVLASKHEIPSA